MAKEGTTYFAVIQHPDKPVFSRKFVYHNVRDWVDPATGVHRPAACLSIGPGASGLYVIVAKSEHADKKIAVLERAVKSGIYPIIGSFSSIADAVVAEHKARPKSSKEKLKLADANARELETLQRENAELLKAYDKLEKSQKISDAPPTGAKK